MTQTTCDLLCGGRLRISQPRQGYRFSIDAVILAGAVRPAPGTRIVDLGAGCGIVALLIAARRPGTSVVAVEIQEELARLARENAAANGLSSRVEVVCGDLRRLERRDLGGAFDWVVSNPPFRHRGSGRLAGNDSRALARHEISVVLEDVLQAARRLLDPGGRVSLVYDAGRAADLLSGMRAAGLEPKRLRGVHGTPRHAARLLLVEGIRGGRPGLRVEPPLFLFAAPGRYTPEVQSFFDLEPRFAGDPEVDFEHETR